MHQVRLQFLCRFGSDVLMLCGPHQQYTGAHHAPGEAAAAKQFGRFSSYVWLALPVSGLHT
jgi:hypothetical protein